MPTPTERHLQVIAEKIDKITKLQQVRASGLQSGRTKAITAELQSIGQIVNQLPNSFKDRYSDVHWKRIGEGESLDTFASDSFDKKLNNIISDLKAASPEIQRHATPDKDFHRDVVNSLENNFLRHSTEWYAHIRTTYLLVSLTVILIFIRIQLTELGIPFSRNQLIAYLTHAFYVVLIVIEIQLSPKLPLIRFSSANQYFTIIEFYDREIKSLNLEISNARKLLNRRRKNRFFLMSYWLVFLILGIWVTIHDTTLSSTNQQLIGG